jgi:hypothetical protein
VSVNLVVAVRLEVVFDPLVGSAPLQPPDAVQLCALVAFHCNVTERPTATVLGLGERVTTGIALAVEPLGVEPLGVEPLGAELGEVGLTCACWQAAKAASIEKTSTRRNPRAAA